LARALATAPKLLMLDESMAGLTSTEVKESVELVKNLRDTGITFLIVEHVMEAIMEVKESVELVKNLRDTGITSCYGSYYAHRG